MLSICWALVLLGDGKAVSATILSRHFVLDTSNPHYIGAPIVEAQLRDDPALADDPQRNNLFEFIRDKQQICPFAAHIRKMNPRGDRDDPKNSIDPHLIPRRGIPFGREVTDEERNTGVTLHERGLYFVCYQSDLSKGFSFLQRRKASFTERSEWR